MGIQDGITKTNRDAVGELLRLRMDVDDGEGPLLGVAVSAFVVFSGRVFGAVKYCKMLLDAVRFRFRFILLSLRFMCRGGVSLPPDS